MSILKSISDLLFSGKKQLAESEIRNVIRTQLTEGSLADVKNFLLKPKNEILQAFQYSQYSQLLKACVTDKDSEGALILFTEFVAQECGVNEKLITNWSKSKEFIRWFNEYIAKQENIPAVPAANSTWTMFDYGYFIGADLQDTVSFSNNLRGNGVSVTDREDTYGKMSGTNTTGSLDNAPDSVKAAAAQAAIDTTPAHSPNVETDKEQSANVDAKGTTKALRAQNVGDNPIDRKIRNQDMVSTQHKKDSLQGRPGNNSQGYGDRPNTGTRSDKYSRKNNSDVEKSQTSRLNAAKNDPSVPEWATRSPSNFDSWEKENGTYQPK